MKRITVFAWLAAAAVAASAAKAELFRTYWRLLPENPQSEADIPYGTPFFRQRLVPIQAAMLDAAVTPKEGGRSYEKGTPLYALYSKDGRSAYCTIKDRSPENQAKTLFIPVLDARPCFRDRDGDGRFDAVFYVTDALSGPPAQGGDMDAITPINPTPFKSIDPSEYPESMAVYFELYKAKIAKNSRVQVTFENAGSRVPWQSIWATANGQGYEIDALNAKIYIESLQDEAAHVRSEWSSSICLRRIRGGMVWERCP